MATSRKQPSNPPSVKIDPKQQSAQAARALREAQIRRQAAAKEAVERPIELKGRKGPEPVRYGDWEKNGIASDF